MAPVLDRLVGWTEMGRAGRRRASRTSAEARAASLRPQLLDLTSSDSSKVSRCGRVQTRARGRERSPSGRGRWKIAQEAQDGLVVGRSDDGGTCGAARVARPSMRRSTRERLADPVHSPRARWQTPYDDNHYRRARSPHLKSNDALMESTGERGGDGGRTVSEAVAAGAAEMSCGAVGEEAKGKD
jgi:hypothetical protein